MKTDFQVIPAECRAKERPVMPVMQRLFVCGEWLLAGSLAGVILSRVLEVLL